MLHLESRAGLLQVFYELLVLQYNMCRAWYVCQELLSTLRTVKIHLKLLMKFIPALQFEKAAPKH